MIMLRRLQISNTHVGGSNGLNLEEAMPNGQAIQFLVQPVQHLYHLQQHHPVRWVLPDDVELCRTLRHYRLGQKGQTLRDPAFERLSPVCDPQPCLRTCQVHVNCSQVCNLSIKLLQRTINTFARFTY